MMSYLLCTSSERHSKVLIDNTTKKMVEPFHCLWLLHAIKVLLLIFPFLYIVLMSYDFCGLCIIFGVRPTSNYFRPPQLINSSEVFLKSVNPNSVTWLIHGYRFASLTKITYWLRVIIVCYRSTIRCMCCVRAFFSRFVTLLWVPSIQFIQATTAVASSRGTST